MKPAAERGKIEFRGARCADSAYLQLGFLRLFRSWSGELLPKG
jgi:hypothetical protein